jgi:hypothetical protein
MLSTIFQHLRGRRRPKNLLELDAKTLGVLGIRTVLYHALHDLTVEALWHAHVVVVVCCVVAVVGGADWADVHADTAAADHVESAITSHDCLGGGRGSECRSRLGDALCESFQQGCKFNTPCFSSSKMEMAALISTRSVGSVETGLVASSAVDSALACVVHGRFNIPAMVDAGIFTHPTKMENGESCCWAALPDMITFWSS